jgi:hypothetical protein
MFRLRFIEGLLVAAIAAVMLAPQYAAAQQISFDKSARGDARYLGSVSLSAAAAASQSRSAVARGSVAVNPWKFNRRIPQSLSAAAGLGQIASVKPPKLKRSVTVQDDSTMMLGFDGLHGYDSWNLNPISNASTAGNLELEPPDQALCVGGGYVVEAVNDALVVYSASSGHSVVAGPVSLYDATGVSLDAQPPGCTLNSTCSFDELADPRCIYDSGKFYLTATHIAYDGMHSDLRLLVLNPATASGTVYEIPTTNDGSDYPGQPSDPGCPCYQDQPLLGADANNIYISGNEFGVSGTSASFNGGQIYALAKSDFTQFAIFPISAASVSPAFSPGGTYDTDNGGTEFFLASAAGASSPQSKIGVVALVGTCAIPGINPTPGCPLTGVVKLVHSPKYALPPTASEAAGPNPLGQSLGITAVPMIDAGDQRMQQVTYVGGRLYGALTTGISVGGQFQSGVMWMSTAPKIKLKVMKKTGAIKVKLNAKLKGGYVAASGYNPFYPAIAATASGRVTIAFDVASSTTWPSIGYANVVGGADQNVHLTSDSAGPDDGFTAYLSGSGGVGRWGDYTAATIDGSGNFWFGGEYIAQTCDSTMYGSDNTCGGTRSPDTNWATHIIGLTP